MEESVRARVLDYAFDDSAVWHLPLGVTVHPLSGELFEAHAPMSAELIRPVLQRLLRDGEVEMRDLDQTERSVLSIKDALAVAASETAWVPPGEPDWVQYEIVLTPSGDAEHEAICDARAREERGC